MIISHVKIIAFQTIINHSFWIVILVEHTVFYIIDTIIHGFLELEIPDLFLILNMNISHSFDALTCEISFQHSK